MIETGRANLVGKVVQFFNYDSENIWFSKNERLNLILGGHYVISKQQDFSTGAVICVTGDRGESIALYSEQVHVVG